MAVVRATEVCYYERLYGITRSLIEMLYSWTVALFIIIIIISIFTNHVIIGTRGCPSAWYALAPHAPHRWAMRVVIAGLIVYTEVPKVI